MFNFSKLQLRSTLQNTCNDIPIDLITWEKEIKRIQRKKKRSRFDKKQWWEYYGLYRYYEGKLFAYLYVLIELGDQKFVEEYNKKHNLYWDKEKNQVTKKGPWQAKNRSENSSTLLPDKKSF